VEGPKLLLPTANRSRNWVKNVTQTPKISVAIGDATFSGTARRLDDGPERQHALALVMRKYWYAAPFMMIARMLFAAGLMTDASTGFEVALDESPAPAQV
ncbi:MAG TPA: nitroreductase/quinone reductase family protein, partial [Candidatus Binataceae bacterium]|nr:nitroreductase/quinone reductase family protein [Candidatus Binataceae bacterium]